MTVTPALLQTLPLLQSLPHVTLAELARQSLVKAYNKREVVLDKGVAPQHLCFLLEGRLQGVDFTMDGKEVGTSLTDPLDFFGELGIVDGELHTETVLAIAKSQVLMIPRAAIRPMLLAMPSMAEALVLRLSRKLREAHEQRRILGLANPLQKVCAQLTILSRNSPSTKVIPDMPTHQELAIMINASRETVTRVFQLLQLKGLVLRDGNNLKIQHITVLREIAQGLREAP
jgi:CRP-like cAMP-binding protein